MTLLLRLGYFKGFNPIIQYCTVDNSYHGLYIQGNATVDYCDFKNGNEEHTITFASTSTVNLDGNNNICPAVGKKAINNRTDSSIDAENNWWGTDSPTDALFTFPAYVDYDPHRDTAASAGVYKPAINDDPLEIAEQFEIAGDFDGALSKYTDLLVAEPNPNWRYFIITSMLRVQDKYNQDYDELRDIIHDEMKSAEGYYRAALRYIISDIDVREGNYQKAIDGFLSNAEIYKDTSIEVEMLGRVAEIYGIYLNDKTKALQYADMAAALNSGQLILKSAYNAADIEYNPALFEDKFQGMVENFDTLPESEEETVTSEITEFVTSYPNPFNPITTITYSIKEPSYVTLNIYSVTGQKVATLADNYVSAGTHAVKFDGSNLASGMYFYRFTSSGFEKKGRMLLVK